ncbi:hypothetical protein OZX65_06680 [Leuconostocaceae bacterium ESL0723]|nr:hypothetical protein OZX65_06680 [Leuconostocaceae bacterium ESL0723]
MWGHSKPKEVSSLEKSKRVMYISQSGHEIIYNEGSKDSFQVSVVEGKWAYPQRDVDYFRVVKCYYTSGYKSMIDSCLQFFVGLIGRDAGNLYGTYDGNPVEQPYFFDIEENTFGYNDSLIRGNLERFKAKYLQICPIEMVPELEEALVVIYLAMISEWYYGATYWKTNTGKQKRSKWQHRIKLLGLSQVLNGQYSCEEAAKWSFRKNVDEISSELSKYQIYSEPFLLR